MKLSKYLKLLAKPITPTVGEKYIDKCIIIEYNDGDVARIDNGRFTETVFLPKRSLDIFAKDMELDQLDKSAELTEIFEAANPNVKQVYLMDC